MPIILDGTTGIDNDATDLSYTGTLTGGTGVVNLGSGQVYKDASGNVGIATSSPAYRLSVAGGDISLSTNAAYLRSTDLAGASTRVLGINSANDTYVGPIDDYAGGEVFYGVADQVDSHRFYTGGAPRLTLTTTTITSGVQLLAPVGAAATPSYSFSGDTDTGMFRPGTNILAFSTAGVEALRFNSNRQAQFRGTALVAAAVNLETATNLWGMAIRDSNSNNSLVLFENSAGGAVGQIARSGSTTVYSTSSDYRLKHDIQPMTGALAKVAALKPCTYKWNADDSSDEGFIAHELAEVCPSAVVGEKDAVNEDGSIKPQGIDTSFLVATLTAAIQEQQAIIESLTARVAALEQP